MPRHREVERKFDAEPDAPLDAALAGLAGVADIARVSDPLVTELAATYYDTADARLARHKITLRRRRGGADEGWHLKLPVGGDARTEVQLPLTDDEAGEQDAVPDELASEVRAIVRAAPLVPVAVLDSHRTERWLLDEGGGKLAVVADDRVESRVLVGEPRPGAWREVEVELIDGDEALLDAVGEQLLAAGVRPAASGSKLARALGDVVPPPVEVPRVTATSTVGDVLVVHLHEQIDELVSRDRGARVDEPEAVHKMRVAARRLRSALSTYRPLLDRARTDPLREELKWIGVVLGQPRDAEVLWARLTDAATAQPVELLLGPVLLRIDIEMQARHRDAHEQLALALDSERYLTLLDALDDLVADPPLTKAARAKARRALPELVSRSCQRVAHAAKAVERADDATRGVRLHDVRKAAKGARYAAESAAPVLRMPAELLAVAMEHLQEDLGEVQDSVTTRAALRQIGIAAHRSGENGFTFGLLHGLEQGRADAALTDYPATLRHALKKARAFDR